MAEFKVEGSGGYIIAELTEEQAKKGRFGSGKIIFGPNWKTQNRENVQTLL